MKYFSNLAEAPELPEVFEDITCEAGKPLELRVPYKGGKPKPTAELFKDGEPVEFDDVEVLDDEVVFKLKQPVHANSGNYGVKLKNPFGEAECTVQQIIQSSFILLF